MQIPTPKKYYNETTIFLADTPLICKSKAS